MKYRAILFGVIMGLTSCQMAPKRAENDKPLDKKIIQDDKASAEEARLWNEMRK